MTKFTEKEEITLNLQEILRESLTVTVYLKGVKRFMFSLWLLKIAAKIGGFNVVMSKDVGVLVVDKEISAIEKLRSK